MSGAITSGLCKMCKKRPGIQNSRYEFAGHPEDGIWICEECERQEADEFHEWEIEWAKRNELPF